MNYQEFITVIGKQARIPFEEAETAARTVMCALAEVMPSGQTGALRDCLPPELGCLLDRCRPEPDPLLDEHIFVGWVVCEIDTTGRRDKTIGGLDLTAVYGGEEAWRRTRYVFAAVRSCLDEAAGVAFIDGLPAWMGQWLREP